MRNKLAVDETLCTPAKSWCGGVVVWWWVCKPIIVFSLAQAEQNQENGQKEFT